MAPDAMHSACSNPKESVTTSRQKTHCPFCGGLLSRRFVEGRDRLYCEACATPLYENPVPASCVVVVDDEERLLLIKRNVPPKVGMWCLPGGFMELGESPEEAAVRELREEAGIDGRIRSLLGVTTNPNPDYGTVLLMGYLIRSWTGVPVAGDDADDARFFPLDDLPEIAFRSHRHFIRNYLLTRN
ncbi:NUDIX hydrolase [Desulfoluna butyratoxydans]|uniref:Nudix hydrolase domain n=1 Tax=Desulfoluna butyratoxydans TaxID=231438 RepID=A0A4U8YIX3_9BACT|nr:NUDIX domain-containing protein [Desulfoluna butyratoxydans]VFQ43635.1 nudix hydrolase domain [Desulfoluna butyratoxydans]